MVYRSLCRTYLPRAIVVLAAAMTCAQSLAQVLRYTVKTEDGQTMLTSLTVSRGNDALIYDAGRLTGVQLIHFTGNGTNIADVSGRGAPWKKPM